MEMPKTFTEAKALITEQAQNLDTLKSELALAETSLAEQEATIQTLTQKNTELTTSLEAKTLELEQINTAKAQAVTELTAKLEAATAENVTLKAAATTVEQKAQQLLASVGQPPVATEASENGKTKPTAGLFGLARVAAAFKGK